MNYANKPALAGMESRKMSNNMNEPTKDNSLREEYLNQLAFVLFQKAYKDLGINDVAKVLAALGWHQTHLDKAVVEAKQQTLLGKIKTFPIIDQQLILGGLIYKYFMLETNATDIKVTLHNFSHKDRVLGNLEIEAHLKESGQKGSEG